MTDDKVTGVTVSGVRWFDSINGNTYHSARVYVERESGNVETVFVPFQYGYDRQYEESAGDALEAAGILMRERRDGPNGYTFTLRRHCEDNGILFASYARDGLKRECKAWGVPD